MPQGDEAFTRWVKANVVRQKQPGYAAAYITLPGGDISTSQFRALAGIARDYAQGEVVTAASQNLVLRWVPVEKLAELHRELESIELGMPGVHTLGDPLGCAGATTCPLAITTSHTLAQVLAERWAGDPGWPAPASLRSPRGPGWLSDDLAGVRLNISGCPNACGQHHLATIGLYGASRKIDGREVPHYNLLLGGRVGEAGTRFGQIVARIPAKRVPEALEALVDAYRRDRQAGDSFLAWIDRLVDTGRLKAWAASVVGPFLAVEDMTDLSDWGQQASFAVKIGENECAA
jgi:sulfite reductase beta subunit-like hemoprotein